ARIRHRRSGRTVQPRLDRDRRGELAALDMAPRPRGGGDRAHGRGTREARDDAVNWRPSADWETLELRARLVAPVRRCIADRGLVEALSPAVGPHARTDPQLANVEARLAVRPGRTWYLHASPEHHMRRLLAAGAPDIWQMGPV